MRADAFARRAFRVPVAAALAGVAFGCIPIGFNTVQQARTDLVGLDRNDIRMCAGFPTKSHSEGDLDIWSYEKASRPSAGVSIPVLPMTLGASMNVSAAIRSSTSPGRS